MRRLTRPLWIALAFVFLVEAWLWDHLEPVVARIVALIPLRRVKVWLAARIERLPPPATLIVFIVPVLVLFPVKVLGLWLLANQHWFAAMGTLVVAKLAGLGVTAFVFDVTRPKLLQMAWFRVVYETVMRWRDWAHALVDPTMEAMRSWARAFRIRSRGTLLRFAQRLRRRARTRA